ncbi:MAG: hypothetical protein ACK5WB_10270 [Phycisphaerales bacterium]|nr:hypothetical protein [Phycisphaeraceae bacterium]
MPRTRHIVIMKNVDPAHAEDGMPTIGSLTEVRAVLDRYNTGTDGTESPNALGSMVLYGPGMVLEILADGGPVRQIMVTMTDDDFAFPVLTRVCREQKWTLLDPETGQRLRFSA